MLGQRRKGGSKLSQHWVNVSCLLGVLAGYICVLHITGCKDIKTVAQLIESKDDLVTVYHLPGSEASGVANLVGEDAVDIKNRFHHIKIHIVGFTLTTVNEFRRFLNQFSTNFHGVLHTLFSIHARLP